MKKNESAEEAAKEPGPVLLLSEGGRSGETQNGGKGITHQKACPIPM